MNRIALHALLGAILNSIMLSSSFGQLANENSMMSYGGWNDGAGSCLFRDYQSIGVNPANLGIYAEDGVTKVNLGFFDSYGLFYSDALPKSQVLSSLFGRNPLSAEEQESIARLFLETGNSYTAEIVPVSLSVQFPKFGGLGFKWRERFSGTTIFTTPLADIVFNGINSDYIDTIIIDVIGNQIGLVDENTNVADLFNGSQVKFNWLREYNLSFGRSVFGNKALSLFAGGSVKFLQSNATADITFDSDSVSGFAAFSSLFDINYANITDPNVQLAGRLTPVGSGMGFDLGATLAVSEKLFAAISVTDIGSIKYTGNLVTVTDALQDSLVNYIGINAATIFSDIDQLFNAQGLFQYLPASEKKVALPTMLHIGGGLHLTKQLDLAADLIQPFNKAPGNLEKTYLAALVGFSPSKNVKISAGFKGGGLTDFDIPAGVSFSLFPYQIWQFSIGTGDIISWVKQDRPTVSITLSLLRFHFE